MDRTAFVRLNGKLFIRNAEGEVCQVDGSPPTREEQEALRGELAELDHGAAMDKARTRWDDPAAHAVIAHLRERPDAELLDSDPAAFQAAFDETRAAMVTVYGSPPQEREAFDAWAKEKERLAGELDAIHKKGWNDSQAVAELLAHDAKRPPAPVDPMRIDPPAAERSESEDVQTILARIRDQYEKEE